MPILSQKVATVDADKLARVNQTHQRTWQSWRGHAVAKIYVVVHE